MGDASLPQDPNMGMEQPMGNDPMGGPMNDPMGGDEGIGMDGGADTMGNDPSMGDNTDQMGDETMDNGPMDDEPMDSEPTDENPESSDDEKVEYGTSIFKGLSPENQDTAIAYMKSMENAEDGGEENGGGQDGLPPTDDGGMQQDGQGDAEQGQPLMEVILTKHQIKKLSENLMQSDSENNDRDDRKPFGKKQSKGNNKSPFNSPKFN